MPKYNPKEARNGKKRDQSRIVKKEGKALSKKLTPLFVIIGVIFLAIVIGITIDYSGRDVEENLNPGDVIFQNIDGSTIKLSSYQGKVVLLYFFYLNCPNCKIADPYLAIIEDDYSSSQLYILTITIDPADSDNDLYNWRDGFNANWDIVRDDLSHSYSSPWNVAYTPTAILFDKNGNFIKKNVGADNFYSKITTEIDALL
ncbi:hypothetical protein LCGC14_0551590 [marine sediment metagenome]|uniref:Thioredoxin domain-containing protein n=1 Tax=marine sediment metagenome TaxID=412755 RepID=A0A0F9RPP4_9ZZZZ